MTKRGFKISGGAVLLAASAYFFGLGGLLCLAALAAAAHELGHYAALRLCGGKAVSLTLGATGFVMQTAGAMPYSKEIIIVVAGPAASAVFAVVAACAARVTQYAPAYQLSGMSLLFCLFNLLPVIPFDGGRILYASCASIFGLDFAERISCVFSCVVIFAELCAGAYLLAVTKNNFTLLAAAVWTFVYYCKNRKNSVVFA